MPLPQPNEWPLPREVPPPPPKPDRGWWWRSKGTVTKLTNAQVSAVSRHSTSVNLGVHAQSVVAPDMPIADLRSEVRNNARIEAQSMHATSVNLGSAAPSLGATAEPPSLEFEANAATDQTVRLMLDGGANLGIANDRSLIAEGELTGVGGRVTGVGSTSKIEEQRRVSISLSGTTTTAGQNANPIVGNLEMSLISGTRRNLVPESTLVDGWGLSIVKTPTASYITSGRVEPPSGEDDVLMPLICERGLYFFDAVVGAPTPSQTAPECFAVHPVDRRASLWAARLHGTASTLEDARRIAADIPKITPQTREHLRSDVAIRMANERRRPVAKRTAADKRASKPGQRLICDCSGPFSQPCVLTGCTYELSAIDECTSRGWVEDVKSHTIEEWIDFLRSVVLEVQKHGHAVLVFRFDRAPELRSDRLKKRLERELSVTVELAPRNHHEGVGRAEVFNDRRERMAEAFCRRAGKPSSYILSARKYAQFIINCRRKKGARKSRFEEFSGAKLDLQTRPPYLFGTWCTLLNEEQTRGPKGSGGRASQGEIMGMTESGAYVVRLHGGGTREQRNVTVVDEWRLLDNGLAARCTVSEVQTQTEETRVPEEVEAAPDHPVVPRPAKPPAHAPRAPDEPNVVGQRIEVEWARYGGFFEGRVTEHRTRSKDGVQEYHVLYDNPGGRWPQSDCDKWHVLDASSSKAVVWRRVQQPEQPNAAPIPRPDQRVTRAARRAIDAAAIELCVPDDLLANVASGEQAEGICEAAIYQLAPHVLESEVAAHECSLAEEAVIGECYKAKQSHVELKTAIGTRVVKVPSNAKQVRASPEREHWAEAQRVALDVLLRREGNQLVKRRHANGPVAKCVTDMKLKIDQKTGQLAAHNGFKARHACDYTRGQPLPKLREQPNFAAVADDMVIKMFIADAAARDRDLTKGDVGDAYLNAKRRNTSKGYMEMPELLKEYDDEGDELVVELTTPCWGEDSAGADWYCEFNDTLVEIGWRLDEAVPCLWYFDGKEGDARMLTIVDDFMISESCDSSYGIADATLNALRAKYGKVTSKREPHDFVGYRIDRDRRARTIRMSMPQKIEEAVQTFFPELTTSKGEHKLPATHKNIKAVEAMADELRLNPDGPQPKKLSRDAKRNQRAIGAMKFFEKVLPAISLPVHRLSCIMANPDGANATAVVNHVLAHAYAHRHEGIVFGGDHLRHDLRRLQAGLMVDMDIADGAPRELEAFGDATWGLFNIYGLMLTYHGAAVFHQTKRIAIACSCSHHAEAIPTARAGELTAYAREVERALGVPPEGRTFIGTDNKANLLVARDAGSAARSKHFLRTYYSLRQRDSRGEIEIGHVNDLNNPADFLTKWIGKAKLDQSVDYATNRRARCEPAEAEA